MEIPEPEFTHSLQLAMKRDVESFLTQQPLRQKIVAFYGIRDVDQITAARVKICARFRHVLVL
jgi:hypothetical protein